MNDLILYFGLFIAWSFDNVYEWQTFSPSWTMVWVSEAPRLLFYSSLNDLCATYMFDAIQTSCIQNRIHSIILI